MRSILLLFLFFWGFNLHAQVEKQVFRIVHNNKNIGVLYAKKNLLDDKIIYSNRTEINTRILTKIQVDYNYKVIYKNDSLFNANVLILLNEKEKTNTYTDTDENVYIFHENDKEKNRIKETITYSTVNLIFEEPENITKVYAEEYGTFHYLKKICSHLYEKTNHKGKTSSYKYKSGKLLEAEIDTGFISFKIIAQ